MKLNKKRL